MASGNQSSRNDPGSIIGNGMGSISKGTWKSSAVPPITVTSEDHVEMREMVAAETINVPLEDDIMKLAILGDEKGIRDLLASGKVDANWRDKDGTTPLHWAAINNRYAVCKILIEAGADVNSIGGESAATPAMWAAQKSHYYIVNLMLKHGADALQKDSQGNNMLHQSTFDGNLHQIILLLHHGMPVDVRDANLHTCLMWSAYKGYAACVDLFLKWGADINATDDMGFTALHWALVKGNFGCIQKLLEYGADKFAKSFDGKTPAITAREMKSTEVWLEALEACGFSPDGTPLHSAAMKALPFSSLFAGLREKQVVMQRFFFIWPGVIMWVVLLLCSVLPIFLSIPMGLITGAGLHWMAKKALDYCPANMKALYKTPYLAGIYGGSVFWVGERWLFSVLPNTFALVPFSNIIFGFLLAGAVYFYAIAMLSDPGYVPKLSSLTEQKAVIDELLSLWKYDDMNFCTSCMVRRPLRSKHCKRCGRCIAKHDHHCPWIFNCVGVKNHRHFFFFIIAMEFGMFMFFRLMVVYLENLPAVPGAACTILQEPFCSPFHIDPFTIIAMFWTAFQAIWVTMLVMVQFVQVARAQTTYENMHSHDRIGHHGRGLSHDERKVANAVASAIAAGSTTMEGAQLTPEGMGPNPNVQSAHHTHDHDRCWARTVKLLGLDAFAHTAQDGLETTRRGRSRRQKQRNPFSRGCIQNCRDFWCDPKPVFVSGLNGSGTGTGGEGVLGGEVVDYFRLYEIPRMDMAGAGGIRGRGGYRSVPGDDNAV